jgi:hypothetical protein
MREELFRVISDDGFCVLHQCNDCGVLIPTFDELCSNCYQRQYDIDNDPDYYGYRRNPGAF